MRYLLEVSSRSLPGREQEYSRWYDETHLGEILALPSFVACERFERLSPDGQEFVELVTLYEVEIDDPQTLLQSLAAATPTLRLTDAMDMESVRIAFLKPTGNGPRLAS